MRPHPHVHVPPHNMERIYRRNLLTQQVWFKLQWILQKGKGVRKRIMIILAFDVLLGLVLLDYTGLDPVSIMCGWLTLYMKTLFHWTYASLEWITSVPIGLKLNNELLTFVVNRFTYILQLWEEFYLFFSSQYLKPLLGSLLYLRFLGFSILLACFHDLLKFLNLYLISYYIIVLRLLQLQTSGLVSLWRLFKGQKFNPLRERVDSCNYDTNQLLLGTLLFTILLFLYPTTLVLYVVLLSLRCVQFVVQLFIRSLIVLLNKVSVHVFRHSMPNQLIIDISKASFQLIGEGKVQVLCVIEGKYFNSLNELELFLKETDSKDVSEGVPVTMEHKLMNWIDTCCF